MRVQEQRSLLWQHCFLIVDLLELAYVRHLVGTPPHAEVNSRINSVSTPSMAYQMSNLMTGKKRASLSMHARQAILKAFTKKWYPQESKLAYITTFSRANWKALSKGEKQKYTLSSCQECREKHYHLQEVFPSTPIYSFPLTKSHSPVQQPTKRSSPVLS